VLNLRISMLAIFSVVHFEHIEFLCLTISFIYSDSYIAPIQYIITQVHPAQSWPKKKDSIEM